MTLYTVSVFKVQQQRVVRVEAEDSAEAKSIALKRVREGKGKVVDPPRKRLVAESRVIIGDPAGPVTPPV